MEKDIVKPEVLFGKYLFGRREMKSRLPQEVYRKLVATIEGGQKLDPAIADYVAAAMKDWALSKGATHFTHWFQPRTEMSAEKHNAFLNHDDEGNAIHNFTGKELVCSEPDASSFPSGGLRATFEARGYCTWDPSSPAFIVASKKGGVLCIPSVFISYDGTPLDMKTPLLKSIDAIRDRSVKLLKLFGNRSVRSVEVTIGAEQEYFLIEESKAMMRPDLDLCGRTLIGAPSPKAQTVEAHYFGSIPPRILAFMEDVERDMYRLGEILMCRHNEVAPCQFEFAPVLSEANSGCDQNFMLLEVMKRMAQRHHLRLLVHEKPFDSVNGSGKHLNFSLRDDQGRNLLKPVDNAKRNLQFLAFMGAFLIGAARYGGLLRASIASAGNMHRLGGHEAPPAVMSVYIGEVLTHALESIVKGTPEDLPGAPRLDLGLNRLCDIAVDNCDRNRTSPIAFTGNKWEFRAVGSSQALAGPLSILLAAWSKGIDEVVAIMEAQLASGRDVTEAALEAIKAAAIESQAVRFDGNGYDPSWPEEARRRGLPVCDTTPQGLDQFLLPQNRQLLADLGVMTEREVDAHYEIRMEQYAASLDVEFKTLRMMMMEGVLPAITKHLARENAALLSLSDCPGLDRWKKDLTTLANIKCQILEALDRLAEMEAQAEAMDLPQRSHYLTDQALPVMREIRSLSDRAEGLVAKDFWPYPTYRDLMILNND